MTMDEEGLWNRVRANIPAAEVCEFATEAEREFYFTETDKGKWKRSATRDDRTHMQRQAFNRMGYDRKLTWCKRPEEIVGPSDAAWQEINAHLGNGGVQPDRTGQRVGPASLRPHAPRRRCLLRRASPSRPRSWAAMSTGRI